MPFIRRLIPNLLTASSLVLALGSILSAELGLLQQAAWFIVWCALLDIADGFVARRLNATSAFGADFDSLADLCAFGLAPVSLVLHFVWQPDLGPPSWRIAAPCALYALFAALRLARFNSQAAPEPGWFRGLPTTASGVLLATGVLVLIQHESDPGGFDGRAALPVIVAILGLAMVSGLRFPKLRLLDDRILNVVHVVNILGVYLCGLLRIWPAYLFVSALTLVLIGLTAGLFTRAQQ
jgi:CDP-diacylglycerol--serine O-phosphatidyltransferase